MRTTLIRVLTTVLTAVLVVVVAAQPASAASFGLQTAANPGTAHDGAARVDGTLTFFGPDALDIRVAIGDICPADGYGAYARLIFSGYVGTSHATGWLWHSDQGCNRTDQYPTRAVYWPSPPSAIVYAVIQVCERDHNGGTWRTGDCRTSAKKYNPYR